MPDKPTETLTPGPLYEFSEEPISDPAALAVLERRLRRPGRSTVPHWLLVAAALLAVVLSGALTIWLLGT